MMQKKERNIVLDIIRGCAALLIVLFHYTSHYNATTDAPLSLQWGVWWGYAAVITFFMLSGFLSARLIFTDTPDGKRYIRGRLRRFYPTYWICMTLTVIVLGVFYVEEALSIGEWAVNLTMVSRLFGVPYADGAYWSMQYELIFCLYVLMLMYVRDKRKVFNILCIWMCVAIALNCLPAEGMPKIIKRVVKILDYAVMSHYCHCFVAGLSLSALMQKPGNRMARLALGLSAVNVVLYSGILSPEFVFFTLTGVLLMLSVRLNPIINSKNPAIRAICYIASISYPLYLIHEMVGFAAFRQYTSAGYTHPIIILPVMTGVIVLAALITSVDRRVGRN